MEVVKLITEEFYDVQLLESANSKDLYVEGIFSSAELSNKNGRKYKKETLVREVNKLINNKIKTHSLWGELNHPNSPEINLKEAAILVELLKWDSNDLKGRAVVLETPMGQIAKALMKRGNVGISSRGLGSVNEDGYVNDSYKLITWDLVGDPSNIPSWVNGIYEAKEWLIADDGNITEGKNHLNKKDKEDARKQAVQEMSILLTPEIIQAVAEDKGISIQESKKIYTNIIKDFIKNIADKI